mmetsp:Transcript_45688/g.81046  ORF Transcript_45688/g.81046 Transcript_45688/m.81046 type:complete len:144 (-) Transcript_45688:160-591(-)
MGCSSTKQASTPQTVSSPTLLETRVPRKNTKGHSVSFRQKIEEVRDYNVTPDTVSRASSRRSSYSKGNSESDNSSSSSSISFHEEGNYRTPCSSRSPISQVSGVRMSGHVSFNDGDDAVSMHYSQSSGGSGFFGRKYGDHIDM